MVAYQVASRPMVDEADYVRRAGLNRLLGVRRTAGNSA
jgi:hypothetical protein